MSTNVNLVTGYYGEPHISSDDLSSYNIASGGDGCFAFDKGSVFAGSVTGSNTVTIADGDAVLQGHHVRIAPGYTESVTVASGSQGTYRKDAICLRYYMDLSTAIESAELVCIQGTSATSASAAVAPTVTGEPYSDGSHRIIDMLLYVASLSDTTLTISARKFTKVPSNKQLNALIDQLSATVASQNTSLTNYINAQHMHPGRTDVLTPQCVGFITNSKKTIDVMVPLKKTLGSDVSGISVYSLYATVRQTGPGYLYGSANAPKAIDPRHCTVYDTRGGLRLVWTESSAINDKAINNGLVSMDVQLRLTLT